MNEEDIIELEKSVAIFMGYTYFPHNMEGVKVPGWKTTIDTDYMRKSNDSYNLFMGGFRFKKEDGTFEIIKEKTEGVKRKYLCRSHKELKYSTDWNWLMGVIVHIQTIDNNRFYISVNPWSMTVIDYKNSENEIVECDFGYDFNLPLNLRYFKVITEFIKWYNNNK
jgi:hypothetical protein